MPFGGLLSLASVGMGAYNMFQGGGADGVQIPQGYQYQNQGGADSNAFNTTNQLSNYNVPAQLLPQYQSIAQSSVNNPYAAMYQGGAGAAGNMGMQAGANAYGAGGSVMGSALDTLPDVQGLLSLGFDPQNALYARGLQQTQDQTRAAEGARGIATTPYGAGVENDATRNFNIDWQNQQLSRAAQGAGAAGNLLGAAGSGINTGSALQGAGAQTYLQGAGTPYNTFQGINANALNTLGQTGAFGASAAAIPQQQIQDYLSYLSGGAQQQGANNQTANLALQQNNQSFNQGQVLGGNLGSALAGLGKASSGWGSSNPFGGGPTQAQSNYWAGGNTGPVQ